VSFDWAGLYVPVTSADQDVIAMPVADAAHFLPAVIARAFRGFAETVLHLRFEAFVTTGYARAGQGRRCAKRASCGCETLAGGSGDVCDLIQSRRRRK